MIRAEEVLDGLRRMSGAGPRSGAEQLQDEEALVRAIAYLEGEARFEAAAVEVYESIPATYNEEHPDVRRHAAALNALGHELAARGLR